MFTKIKYMYIGYWLVKKSSFGRRISLALLLENRFFRGYFRIQILKMVVQIGTTNTTKIVFNI